MISGIVREIKECVYSEDEGRGKVRKQYKYTTGKCKIQVNAAFCS